MMGDQDIWVINALSRSEVIYIYTVQNDKEWLRWFRERNYAVKKKMKTYQGRRK